MKIRILVADDHDIVRAGVRSLLERHEDVEVVGEAGDGREVVRFADNRSIRHRHGHRDAATQRY